MITDLLFDRTACPDLEQSMNVYSLRHKTLSNNIANAMTPRYKAQKVDFEEEYKKPSHQVISKVIKQIVNIWI